MLLFSGAPAGGRAICVVAFPWDMWLVVQGLSDKVFRKGRVAEIGPPSSGVIVVKLEEAPHEEVDVDVGSADLFFDSVE